MIHSLKYQGSTTLSCKVTGMRKSEFVAKTQFLSGIFLCWFGSEVYTHILSYPPPLHSPQGRLREI